MTEENLGKVYDIYFNQNPEKSGSGDQSEVHKGTTTLMSGGAFNGAMNKLAGNFRLIQSIKNTDTVPEDANTQVISTLESEKETVMYFDAETGTIYVSTDAKTIYLNGDSSEMFTGCSNLKNIEGLSNWNTENVTNMHYMFCYCNKLSDIGALADWDTGNVTDMSSMFDGCSSLTDLNALINWDTSAVNNMKAMFNGISQLTDTSALNDWDILNTSNFTNMFLNCPSHPEFTKRPGTWDGNGTFIPSA